MYYDRNLDKIIPSNFIFFLIHFSVLGLEPTFDVPIVNVTVVAGQTAVLPCSIDYLGKYKVNYMQLFSKLNAINLLKNLTSDK